MSQVDYMEEESPPQQNLEDFLKKLEIQTDAEEKLKECIGFMQESLAQPGNANFKGFWEVRKCCIPLFKENIPPNSRTQLWSTYVELTKEGRKLKNLVDEDTAFSVEQIDLAISGLETEVQGYHTHLEEILQKMADVGFSVEIRTLERNFSLYQRLQKQLNLLNLYASRINSLRKELINMDMRVRQKNKFFQRLSQLGDQVFPNRKDLIQEISNLFVEDVTAFIDEYFTSDNFNEETIRRYVFFFRGEIKNLQAVAKVFTLNTHAFSMMREMLSSCWDKLKGMEKELKKEYAEHKQKSAENAAEVKERIDSFIKAYEENPSFVEGMREIDAISRFMRTVSLTRSDVQMLKDELRQAQLPLIEKQNEEEDLRRRKEIEFENIRQGKITDFQERLQKLKDAISTLPAEQSTGELEELRRVLPTLHIPKGERQQTERTLKAIRDQIAERRSQILLSLSDDDRAALDNLEVLLSQLTERRKEIKNQIEEYRKVIGGSGLDFEKAMHYNELMGVEKESLSKIDESMGEIKKKMEDFKKSKDTSSSS